MYSGKVNTALQGSPGGEDEQPIHLCQGPGYGIISICLRSYIVVSADLQAIMSQVGSDEHMSDCSSPTAADHEMKHDGKVCVCHKHLDLVVVCAPFETNGMSSGYATVFLKWLH